MTKLLARVDGRSGREGFGGAGGGPYKWIRRVRKGWLIEEDVLTGSVVGVRLSGVGQILSGRGVNRGWILSPLNFVRHSLDGDEAR